METSKTAIEHFDHLGQAIHPGDYVSFTWASCRGIHVGRILKLTKQRVRIVFNRSFVHDNVRHEYTGYHIARPTDCLVLGQTLQQQLTIATLQKKI
jgi:hypothetical protein